MKRSEILPFTNNNVITILDYYTNSNVIDRKTIAAQEFQISQKPFVHAQCAHVDPYETVWESNVLSDSQMAWNKSCFILHSI